MKASVIHRIALFSLATSMFAFHGCKKDSDDPNPKQEITSFSPTSGNVGTVVTITGKNFSPTASDNVVAFNDKSAVATSSTATTITVAVPDGATSGKITVTINGISVTSADEFTIVEPTITEVTPPYGLPGDDITITGTNFGVGAENNVVKINGTPVEIVSATATEVVVTVPGDATTGKVTVTTGNSTATSLDDFEVLKDIPRSGLVAFYPFTGNANDASGHSLNGTPSGGPTLFSDRFGSANRAYLFDGVDDKIDMGNPTLLQISGAITISAWVNMHAYKTGGNRMQSVLTKIFFDPAAGGNPSLGYQMYQDFTGGNAATFGVTSFSTAGLTLSNYVGSSAELNQWIHLTLTIDGKTWKFYQNATNTHGATIANNILDDGSKGNLTIGTYGGGFFFDGIIDDIAIYNRALSSDEVTQLYNQTATKY